MVRSIVVMSRRKQHSRTHTHHTTHITRTKFSLDGHQQTGRQAGIDRINHARGCSLTAASLMTQTHTYTYTYTPLRKGR